MKNDEVAVSHRLNRDIYSFVESINEIFILMDNDKVIVAASPMARDFFGIDPRDGDRVKIDKFFPVVYVDAIFRRAESSGDAIKTSLSFTVKNAVGVDVAVETRFNRYADERGEFIALTCRDVGEYTKKIGDLTSREDLYRTIFHESPVGIIHINSDGIIADCNSIFLQIFGFIRFALIGLCIADDGALQDYPRIKGAAMDAIKGFGSKYEAKIKTSGEPPGTRWVRVSFSPIVSENHSFLGAVGIIEDVTEAKEAEQKVEFISNHDALTGLFNRRACEEALIEYGKRENLPLGVIYVDLNHLKLANDAFGHHEGDALIQKCVSILNANTTPNDSGYRWGGDEFLLLLRNTDRTELKSRVNNINRMCVAWSDDGLVRPSMAVGCAVKVSEHQDIDEVVKEAEDEMYANKLRNGKQVRQRLLSTLVAKQQTLMDGAVGRKGERMLLWADWALKNLNIPNENDKKNLRQLCMYHDIGILACSDELEVLREKPTSRISVAPMQHMAVGYRIARSIAEISPVADYILSHHEHWDGSGYPNQSKGTDIPYLSRLVSILDSIESMLTLNSKSVGPSFEAILDSIEACSGKLFDPELAEEIISILRVEPPTFIDHLED